MSELKRIKNENLPASSKTKFEEAVFMAMQGLLSNTIVINEWLPDIIADTAIETAKEVFIKLENCKNTMPEK